ncbi:cystathionine gamma-synthase [Streptococcus thoraltensis]|uniref:cystathionine gamma-synthase n=1 Tax=Streptococcus thoraltensis TaxID=55085 RepID=UPI001F59A767|nr:cystathionine gamma-synthase [Streptococcus thoraltensis]
MTKDYQLATVLAQAGIKSDDATGSLVAPIHLSTTYQHPEFGKSTGFDYTRTKNPTRSILEETLAKIERADFAIATSSGMSAVVLAFSLFSYGSKVVAARDLYGGAFRWFNNQEAQGRFKFTYTNTEEEMIASIDESTDVVYIETPTNPLMVEFDIEKVAKVAHDNGAKVLVDNTFYSPVYQNPILLGADIVIHSATKYLSGHNDVLAGVVVTDNEELFDELMYHYNTTGPNLSPLDSYLLMRGLKTLKIRMEAVTKNAQELAIFLENHVAIREVLYTGRGGMVSFKVKDQGKIPELLNSLKIISFAESLGGVESLITYPATQTHADIPAEVRSSYGLTNDLLRLSVGIEDIRDLKADLEQALNK